MDKKFSLILIGIIIMMVGLFAVAGDKQSSNSSDFEGNPRTILDGDYIRGSTDAKVTIIEYADFQCPGCAALFPAIQQVEAEFGDDIAVVFRHFPLVSIHPNSMASHRAAEAAGLQGKFFEMHDLLFGRSLEWSSTSNAGAIFESYALELSLDIEKFKSDVASETVFKAISFDQDSGNQLNISATPTLLLNGQEIPTPASVDELRQTIQATIDQANQSNQ
jgi:protein-disulfide isomerase